MSEPTECLREFHAHHILEDCSALFELSKWGEPCDMSMEIDAQHFVEAECGKPGDLIRELWG